MDKLMSFINSHAEYNMELIYSTPSQYLKAVHDADLTWNVYEYDFFPYAGLFSFFFSQNSQKPMDKPIYH
jgi:hypothetical protein